MPDRINLHHEELIAALSDINATLKRMTTYVSSAANIGLSSGATATVGVSGALGGISVLHDFVGSVAAVAGVSGDMLTTWGSGVSSASSSASGGMSIAKDLQAITTPVGGASGTLVFVHRVAGTVAAVSTVSGALTNSDMEGSVSAVSFIPTIQLFINGVA